MLEYAFLRENLRLLDLVDDALIVHSGTKEGIDTFYLGTKPKATPRNYVGDREVMHVQLHGNCFTLPSNWKLTSKARTPYRAQVSYYGAPNTKRNADFRVLVFYGMTPITSRSIDLASATLRYYGVIGGHLCVLIVSGYVAGSRITITISPSVYSKNPQTNKYTGEKRWWKATSFNGEIRGMDYEWNGKSYTSPSLTNPSCSKSNLPYLPTIKLGNIVTPADKGTVESLVPRLVMHYMQEMQRLVTSRVFGGGNWGFSLGSKVFISPGDIPSIQGLFKLRQALLADAQELSTFDMRDVRTLMGDATQQAVDACIAFDGNTLPLVKELIELKDTLLDLISLLRGDVSLKNVADLWLSARYGIKLTYQDLRDLIIAIRKEATREIKRMPYSKVRGRATSKDVVVGAKLYYDPINRSAFAKQVDWLFKWDIFPTATNGWDIIPYSFVVDWFADVEGFLKAIDTHTFLSVLNVFKTCYTVKRTVQIPNPTSWHGICVSGGYVTRFMRITPDEPYQPVPSFSGSLPSVCNLIDGTALIIQRTR